ncbi:MAG: methionyl-tRNA formyltransferase [Synergistaceae bacterium]|nr:methionyl-tRNA formyltransferase [Synergistaceae bacterium]
MRLWAIVSGPFGALCLDHLAALAPLERVIVGMPSRAGRGMKEVPSPAEERALALGLPFVRTGPLGQDEALLRAVEGDPPDAIVVTDFGQVVREPFLSAPRWGCLNIHPSLLPRWRGAAPVQRALMAGDDETGVTVFRLVPEMDAGPILRQASVRIDPDVRATDLYRELSALGAELLVEGLEALRDGTASFREQDASLASHAPKLAREEHEVSWSWSAKRAHDAVRALDASGGAFVLFEGERLKLWRTTVVPDILEEPGTILRLDEEGPVVACGEGALRLVEVQAPGKRRTAGADWARGARLAIGGRADGTDERYLSDDG